MSKSIERAADALAYMESTLLALPRPEEQWRLLKALWALDSYLTGRSGARMGDEPDVSDLLHDGKQFNVRLSDGGRSRLLLQAGGPDHPPILLDRNLSTPQVVSKWDKLMEFVRKGNRS